MGKRLHLLRWSRLDIWNVVRKYSRRMTTFNVGHMKALKISGGWTLRQNKNQMVETKPLRSILMEKQIQTMHHVHI